MDCRYCKLVVIMLAKSLSLALICHFIIAIPFSLATTSPYSSRSQTADSYHRQGLINIAKFANSTKITFSNAAGTTDCPTNCSREVGPLGSVTWTSKFVTATITAETLVYVFNKKTNSTRTETITNTEVDLKGYTPLSATKSTAVTFQFGTTSRTEIL